MYVAPLKHPAYIYDLSFAGNSGRQFILCPFEIAVDPMERLLLINFEKDPDDIYIGFEPQVFDDNINGRGMLVIGWRKDGKVDVYHEAGLKLMPEKYDIAGKGLEQMVRTDLAGSYFNVTEKGVQARIEFQDFMGRKIEIKIKESHPKKRKPFGLLAPMGDAAEKPSAMPLVLLHDFYFVRRKHTFISIIINAKAHKPDKLPFPLDGTCMYFTRYSPDPTIATVNPAFDGELPLISLKENSVRWKNMNLQLSDNGLVKEIQAVEVAYKDRNVSLRFEPSFPNLSALSPNTVVRGRFTIREDPEIGKIKGKYLLQSKDDEIVINMRPSKGWIPNEKKWSLNIMYALISIFRKWPSTYKWSALLNRHQESGFRMRSTWERIKQKS